MRERPCIACLGSPSNKDIKYVNLDTTGKSVSWTVTENWSQKLGHCKTSPENLGKFNFGNFTSTGLFDPLVQLSAFASGTGAASSSNFSVANTRDFITESRTSAAVLMSFKSTVSSSIVSSYSPWTSSKFAHLLSNSSMADTSLVIVREAVSDKTFSKFWLARVIQPLHAVRFCARSSDIVTDWI